MPGHWPDRKKQIKMHRRTGYTERASEAEHFTLSPSCFLAKIRCPLTDREEILSGHCHVWSSWCNIACVIPTRCSSLRSCMSSNCHMPDATYTCIQSNMMEDAAPIWSPDKSKPFGFRFQPASCSFFWKRVFANSDFKERSSRKVSMMLSSVFGRNRLRSRQVLGWRYPRASCLWSRDLWSQILAHRGQKKVPAAPLQSRVSFSAASSPNKMLTLPKIVAFVPSNRSKTMPLRKSYGSINICIEIFMNSDILPGSSFTTSLRQMLRINQSLSLERLFKSKHSSDQ